MKILLPLLICLNSSFIMSSLIGQTKSNANSSTILHNILSEEKAFSEAINDLKKSTWLTDNYELKNKLDQYQNWITRLATIQKNELNESEYITLDFLNLVISDRIEQIENKSYLMPLNAEGGFLTSMFYSSQYLILYDEERKDDYLKKLKSIPTFINEQIKNLKKGLDQNIVVPKLVIENSLQILRNQLSSKDSLHFLIRPIFRTKDDRFIEECLTLFSKVIRPSFDDLASFLIEEYILQTRKRIGILNNENGKQFYEQRVQYFTTLDMTPKEVYDLGLSEVARIKIQMEDIIARLKFDGTFEEFFEYLRTDEQFYAKTRKEILQEAAWLSKKAEEFLPQYFEVLPSLPFTVKPVPDDIAPSYTAGRYSGGSYTQQRAGSYWVNTYDLPSRPLYALPALTLHEAVPGHHLQGSLAQEMKDVPDIRTNTYLSAFGEGWALYCEYLGKEAGYYKTDYDEFGRLTYEMWRACRLVVDPGIHYFGWTRDEAVDYMASHTALSIHEVNTEIDRYIGWPGQAVSYKIGELKIRELRKRCEKKLGDQFDIRSFHNQILKNGSVPLFTLERIIDQYIIQKTEKIEE